MTEAQAAEMLVHLAKINAGVQLVAAAALLALGCLFFLSYRSGRK